MAKKPVKRGAGKKSGPVGKKKRQRKKAERQVERKAVRRDQAKNEERQARSDLVIVPSADARPQQGTGEDVPPNRKQPRHSNRPSEEPAKTQGKGKSKGTKQGPATGSMNAVKAPLCKKYHKMQLRTTNPTVYTKKACCDVCGLMNLAVKRKEFFHCSFCHFDLCPKCAGEWDPKAVRKEERMATMAALTAAAEKAKKKAEKKAEQGFDNEQSSEEAEDFKPEPVEVREAAKRLKVWIPTEEVSTNRAPLTAAAPVTTWVEGVPL